MKLDRTSHLILLTGLLWAAPGLWPPAAAQSDLERLQQHLQRLESGEPMETYLAAELKRTGLAAPFPRARYTQEFSDGVNVLARVEGLHPQFRNQVVVVAVNDPREFGAGRPARGASTRAAPHAVMLLVAEAMANAPCQRSLLFVSFNPTEKRGRGAEHFLAHLPVAEEQIVLSLHLGSLGRAYGDFMKGVVWAAGVEYCPELDEVVAAATAETGLYVLPVAASVLDLSSAHNAFLGRRLPGLLFSSGEHGDSGLDSDRLEALDRLNLLRFARYLVALLGLVGDHAITPQCRPSPALFASEFSSYAVQCGVLVNLEQQGRLPLWGLAGLVEEASRLRTEAIALCEMEIMPPIEAERVQREMRRLNERLTGAMRSRRPPPVEAAVVELSAEPERPSRLRDFTPPTPGGFREETRVRASEFVIPEGGIEVVDLTLKAEPEATTAEPAGATDVELLDFAPPAVVEEATPPLRVETATPAAVLEAATAELRVEAATPTAEIAPATRQARQAPPPSAPPTPEKPKQPDAGRFLKPPAWLQR